MLTPLHVDIDHRKMFGGRNIGDIRIVQMMQYTTDNHPFDVFYNVITDRYDHFLDKQTRQVYNNIWNHRDITHIQELAIKEYLINFKRGNK